MSTAIARRDEIDQAVTGKGNKERVLRIRSKLLDELREIFHGAMYLFETSSGRAFSRYYVHEQLEDDELLDPEDGE